jgi:hypothetical protein
MLGGVAVVSGAAVDELDFEPSLRISIPAAAPPAMAPRIMISFLCPCPGEPHEAAGGPQQCQPLFPRSCALPWLKPHPRCS